MAAETPAAFITKREPGPYSFFVRRVASAILETASSQDILLNFPSPRAAMRSIGNLNLFDVR